MAIQFIVTGPLPNVAVVAPDTVNIPFCIVPAVHVKFPLTVKVNPPRSIVPDVRVKLVHPVVELSKTGVLAVETIIISSVAEGVPVLGVQLF